MQDLVLVMDFDHDVSRTVARMLRAERVNCKILPGETKYPQNNTRKGFFQADFSDLLRLCPYVLTVNRHASAIGLYEAIEHLHKSRFS